ncbi:ParB/RepB/Spo0J family partition protein [Candidatus Omnitrophota bacterium]
MDIKRVRIARISPNDYNPNVVPEDILAKLGAEISQKGLCEPIVVRKRGNGYVIVDGEHRWRICRDLGWKKVPCIIKEFDDDEAKIKTIQLNYMRGSAVPIKLASLIHSLNKEVKLEDLEKRLPYEKVQLKDHLELLKLPDDYGETIKKQSQEEEKALPVVMSFVVFKEQAEIIENALDLANQVLPETAKNSKGSALEKICSYYVDKQQVTTKEQST